MELREAITEIAAIRRQMALAERFRGYRALPVALGAIVALGAALVQPILVADPARDLNGYLRLWIAVAMIAGLLPAVDVCVRHKIWWAFSASRSLEKSQARLACEQFAPCVVAGGLLTAVIDSSAPQVGWMLPGLWGMIFSLGLFASYRMVPPAMLLVATWYLLSGCVCLAAGPQIAGLAPWTMALIFGGGQAATALVLWLPDREVEDAA